MPMTDLFSGVQVMYDPITKSAMIIRHERLIPVPGYFPNYSEAFSASRALLREKFPQLAD